MNQPDHAYYQQLFDELRNLDSVPVTGYTARKYKIIDKLAEAGFYEAKPYFIAGLQNPDKTYRFACIQALVTLWQDADPQIVSQLLEMSINDPDISVRYLAIDALKLLQSPEALPILKRIVENRNDELQLRDTAYKAFVEIAGNFPEIKGFPNFDLQAECRNLFEELQRLDALSTHEFTEREYRIMDDLANAGFYEARSYFFAGLDNKDPAYRNVCISAFRTWEDTSPEVVSKLLYMAKHDPEGAVRDYALFVLGSLKVKEALPLLKRIVEDDTKSFLARKNAYSQILDIYDYPPQKSLTIMQKFDLNSMDQELLASIPDE